MTSPAPDGGMAFQRPQRRDQLLKDYTVEIPPFQRTLKEALVGPAVPFCARTPRGPLNVADDGEVLCQGTRRPTSSPIARRNNNAQMMASQRMRRCWYLVASQMGHLVTVKGDEG